MKLYFIKDIYLNKYLNFDENDNQPILVDYVERAKIFFSKKEIFSTPILQNNLFYSSEKRYKVFSVKNKKAIQIIENILYKNKCKCFA